MAALKGSPKSPAKEPNKAPSKTRKRVPSQADYEALSQFRYLIRCFAGVQPGGGEGRGPDARGGIRPCWRIRGFRGGGAGHDR